jgi:tRNA/tmRNA/rRNA uracil-C5-methylase (TrmA/RlmC/RlmD family)
VESVTSGGLQPGREGRPAAGGATLELAISGVAHGGWCVARDAAGRVVFVRHALPGERVRARVTDATTSFARAEAVEVLQASPDRVAPPCPHARPGGCGGCDWQHAELGAQRRIKAEVIADQLRRIAGLHRDVTVEPVPGDDDGLGWRTRVRYTVGPDGTAGLLAHRSHDVIDVGDCPIAHPVVNAAGVTRRRWEATSVEVVASPTSGEHTVIVTPSRAASPHPRASRPPPASPGPLRQHAAGRSWRVSAGAFWQVHPGAPDTLTGAVLDVLRPRPGDVALDLFCGAGLFAGALAARVGPEGAVIAVDSDRTAVRDARRNLRGTPWVRVHVGDVARVLAGGGWPQPGLAVLDPPRTGVSRRVIERLLAPRGLRRVAYVSCDPATLARDIAAFAAFGWKLDALRAFDAFPMTHHVECVAARTPGGGARPPPRGGPPRDAASPGACAPRPPPLCLSHSVRSAVAVRVLAAQPAGSNAASTAITSPASASAAISPAPYTLR